MGEPRTIIVCNWHDCPFVADATSRFAEKHGLTSRERDVLELVVDGLDVAGIAEALVISMGTVKAHLHRIYQKAGVSGRAELMRAYAAFGRS
ncbi:MAG: helix-turn-helix transcriptional regulator [Atopobiaceae bacterium]|nr:helix-turn-helix transcriptional regulator [Atopobiaceae bacterium]